MFDKICFTAAKDAAELTVITMFLKQVAKTGPDSIGGGVVNKGGGKGVKSTLVSSGRSFESCSFLCILFYLFPLYIFTCVAFCVGFLVIKQSSV